MIIASCFIMKKEGDSRQVVSLHDYELDDEAIAQLQNNIKEVVKEYSNNVVEDTNRQLTALSNQSMVQISELAEQVLADIEKNHKECVFLYDMLEDKGKQLKAYVSNSAEQLLTAQAEETEQLEEISEQTEKEEKETPRQVTEHLMEQVKGTGEQVFYEEDMEGTKQVQERNQQILRMYQSGMEPIAIAKELDLGVGEVQLIVGLFQGEK